jgi:hypothetical protein
MWEAIINHQSGCRIQPVLEKRTLYFFGAVVQSNNNVNQQIFFKPRS